MSTTQTNLTLEDVEESFKSWRSSEKDSWQIPEELWDKVMTILPHYPKQKIAKILSLTFKQLNQKIKSCEDLSIESTPDSPRKILSKESFVEVSMQPTVVKTLENKDQISIIKPDGLILKLPKPDYDEMVDLLLKFCRA